MKWYCEKCKKIHSDDELCHHIKKQLKKHPELLSEAANFATIAGEYALVSSQALDGVCQAVNKVAGSNLSFEGTHQYARDIQVFKRLNEEAFVRAGYFSNSEIAKEYLEIAKNNPNVMQSLDSKLTGSAQEVDWLRFKQGQLSSLSEKSSLLNKNAPGVDGETINRFTGKQISRTTIKASSLSPKGDAQTQANIESNIGKVKEAIEKGNATENDIIYGVKGSKKAAETLDLNNKVIEYNTPKQVSLSNERLKQKIANGQAVTSVTLEEIGKKMSQGAVIGAAVGLTVSSITTYIRYKNGELTKKAAFADVAEDTLNSAIVGGAMAGITIFLPAGPLGVIAGVAIGIYLGAVTKNILDEVFGKGAFGAILNSSGYVYGMTLNLVDCYEKINENMKVTNSNLGQAKNIQKEIEANFDLFDSMKERF